MSGFPDGKDNMNDNCIFCKLANGVFPTATVYEDDDFRAILDIEPAAKGHVLLIPKAHMANLLEADDATLAKALPLAKKIANAVKEALSCDGVNILQNNCEAAWQSVFHLHIHIIPRYENDGVIIPWEKNSYADGEAAEYAAKIAACIK